MDTRIRWKPRKSLSGAGFPGIGGTRISTGEMHFFTDITPTFDMPGTRESYNRLWPTGKIIDKNAMSGIRMPTASTAIR
jgi:hypothetical protein